MGSVRTGVGGEIQDESDVLMQAAVWRVAPSIEAVETVGRGLGGDEEGSLGRIESQVILRHPHVKRRS